MSDSPAPASIDPQDYVAIHNLQQATDRDEDNQHVTERYTGGMANYNTWIDQIGTLPPWNPPALPNGYTLSDPDAGGFVYEIPSNQPACAPILVHPIPGQKLPPGVHIGHAVSGSTMFFQALPGDTTPTGEKVNGTSSDGVDGQFQKMEGIFGAGIYFRIGPKKGA